MLLAETDEATDESAFLMWLATLNTVGFSAHRGKGCVDTGGELSSTAGNP